MKQEKEVLLQGKMMEVRGKKLYVETYGSIENPPVLYLHGGPGEMCYDFSYHQAHRLQDFFRLIAIDQRGVGRSEKISQQEPFGLRDLIEDCEELRKMLQIEKWSVIGHSFGGFLALLYAAMYPQSIQKIIFEGPSFDFALTSRALLKKTGNILRKYGKEEQAKECIALSKSNATSEELLESYIKLSDELEENRMEIYNNFKDETDYTLYSDEEWEEFSHRSEIHFARLKEEGEFHTSLLPKLKDVENPMLLMIGKYDVVTCEKQIQAFNKDARHGKVIVFEESGHTPHYEVADEFAKTVIDFLK
ncbi:alpha/beta hydrolase [Bacillus pseudomycoides]|uniref:prolyl aminopeptidase n=1 Tax=Bacillus pseudomycoides TaxID=64104 RepID=A0AA91VDA0_9BACI|nr:MULTISPECIES: alpha/beta hydrolase [Bacillus]PEB51256.1 alpha/beta hydrolase [Bacillus sp. AFS098217]PED82919.1 alpha/beta hydrolase [Bacillus pseudomycoides]PEU05307.1 alpha/beta hydrolase [Bacillus sp. AFS019443]PEU08974.1 alpha/beta hydrolase [Bacillus sp. AFS014408]PFW65226.1 alpha/beta hydrolase [Bacillus sp. AFS075034]